VKVRKGTLSTLPASVERLHFRNAVLPVFPNQSHADDQAIVSQLAEIDFSGTIALTWAEIYFTTKAWPHVKTLKLNNTTYSGGPPFVFLLHSQNLHQMEVLEANGVPLDDDWNIGLICQKLTNLRRLSIARCWLSDVGALRIASDLTKLESLDISGCAPFTQVAFFVFANLRATLRFLDVSDTNVDSDSVDVLRLCMPDCEIVH